MVANVFVVVILTVYRGTHLHIPEQSVEKAGGLSSWLHFYLQFVVTCECPAFPVVSERPNEHLRG
jgi:hypothetical protein